MIILGSAASPGIHGADSWAPFSVAQSLKKHEKCNQTIMPKTSTPNYQHRCRKGTKKGDEIDAKTLQKALSKQVSDNIMKIIENHIFLNGKINQIHFVKTRFF